MDNIRYQPFCIENILNNMKNITQNITKVLQADNNLLSGNKNDCFI